MTVLRQKMQEDLQLRGLAPTTRQAYLRAVEQSAKHYGKSPAQLDEENIRQYFLYLKNEKKASRSSMSIALCGIKFFYEETLKREWRIFNLLKTL